MKRVIGICLVIIMLVSMFVGCGQEVQPNNDTQQQTNNQGNTVDNNDAKDTPKDTSNEKKFSGKIEFMTGTSVDSALFIAYEEIAKEFNKIYPDLKIELLPSSTDHEGEVKTRLASNNAPDIWMTHGWSVGRYANFLEPLTNREWAGKLSPALAPVMLDTNNDLFAFPIDLDVAGILYNKEVLADVGVKIEDIKTWEDFDAVCKKVADKGIVPIYTAGKDRWPTGLFIDWIGPGAFTNQDLNGLLNGTFARESWGKTLEIVEGFRDSGYINPDYASATSNDVALALATKQTAFSFLMNFVAVESYNLDPNAAVGFMQCPAFTEDGKPFLITGEKNALGVYKDSKNKEACLEYIDFLAKDENLAKLVKATGSASGLTTVTADLGGLTDSMELTKVLATVPYFDRVYMPSGSWDSIVATTDGIVTGQMTIDEALDKMESDYNNLYEKSKNK